MKKYSSLIYTLKVNYALNKLNQLFTYLFVLKNTKNMKILNLDNKNSLKKHKTYLVLIFENCF